MRLIPWAILGALVLYRRTWGACDCEGLKDRLRAAHREVAGYQLENRSMAVKLYGEAQDHA